MYLVVSPRLNRIRGLIALYPNCHLAACHQEYSDLCQSVPCLRLADVPHALQCVLWGRARERIISVAEHKGRAEAAVL